ncbi:MAG TPA: LLM class flavin-dependent oxidoreductase [Pseudonocardiaceae bacterium]|nr:LLM class flavin-dependent oxidoreductase [Pseudonocardiaceae bacterium]
MTAFDCPKAERGRRLEQCLTDVRTLWGMPTFGDVAPTVVDPISLAPVQANVPIWVAGTSDAGVRRAARVGEAWYVGPGTNVATLDRQLDVYRGELARIGRDMPSVLPIRRDVFLTTGAADRQRLDATLARRYQAQGESGYQGDLPSTDRAARADLAASGADWTGLVGPEVISGDLHECADQLVELATHIPTEALVVLRVAWPHLDSAGVLDQLDALGELTPRLADVGAKQTDG